MLRPQDDKIVETVSNWTLYNPIVPYGIIAVNSDGSGFKVGDGLNKWADLDYVGDVAIRGKLIQSNRDPYNNELLVYCSSQDKWVYRSQGCIDNETNWSTNGSIFPTMTMLVEIDDSTSRPTGRFKVSDGVTAFPSIPWFGKDFDTTSWPTNYSLEFNGTEFEPVHYVKVDELQMSTNPVGAFHRDDGTFALISDTYVTGDTSSTVNNIVVFNDTTGKSIIDSNLNINDLPASIGTPNTYYQLDLGVGPKLTNVGGDLTVYKDDGSTLANITTNTNTSIYGQFGTVYIGFPTETTSITLTSDGTYLYIDGNRVLDINHLIGLDADTLDGYHATSFASNIHTHAEFPTTGNLTEVSDTAFMDVLIFG